MSLAAILAQKGRVSRFWYLLFGSRLTNELSSPWIQVSAVKPRLLKSRGRCSRGLTGLVTKEGQLLVNWLQSQACSLAYIEFYVVVLLIAMAMEKAGR